MATMNGVTVGKKPIRVNWAHQKNASSTVASLTGSIAEGGKIGAYSSSAIFVPPTKPSLNYNQVLNQASAYHTTVYVGGIPPNCTIDMLTPVFQPYGHLVDIRVTPERGFAFVRYDSHENAATAISYVHGLVLNGCKLKLSWGKDKAADALYAKQQLEVTTPASSATSPNSYYGANAMQSAGYQSYYGGMAMPAYNGYDQATAYYYACYDPQWKEYYEKTYGPMPANNQQQVAQAQPQGQAQQQQGQQSQYQAQGNNNNGN
jgi:nucleolysin TIA-1/TIAR